MKISIIYSTDYDFQVVQFVEGDSKKASNIANKMYDDKMFKQCGIEHYDVAEFDTILDCNIWMLEKLSASRQKKRSQQVVKIS